MDFKLELIAVPVSDVDRSKAFYADQVGFNADHDHQVNEQLRFVQLTPPGSGCSIAIGTGIVDTEPGSVHALDAAGIPWRTPRHTGRQPAQVAAELEELGAVRQRGSAPLDQTGARPAGA
jgi:catechol 2,3-dioxygenase-like lactoylglutathione lyase family enzyme